MKQQQWQNWSGSLRFVPQHQVYPGSEAEIVQLVQQAGRRRGQVRVVGAGHSSAPLVQTGDVLVSLQHFQGLVSYDTERRQATVRAGMSIRDAGQALQQVGLAMPNTGDVDVQLVAGAIGTGTHGTGRQLQNLSAMLIGARIVTAAGDILEKHQETDPEFLQALRVSLGTFGILTELRLQLLPAFQLHRREVYTHIDDCLHHYQELAAQHRNFDFYWYPRNDLVKMRFLDFPGPDLPPLPCAHRLDKEMTGWSHEVLPRHRELRFDEMEYALPAEAAMDCFCEVRQRIKQKHRQQVAWRVLFRTIAADDAFLSPCYGRDTVTISLHHNAGLPYDAYFQDLEPIFKAYRGRPHWGKKHYLKSPELYELYPCLPRFLEMRRQLDPGGLFLNQYLKTLWDIA